MVWQIYHQTSGAAILVSATARVIRFANSFKRWKTLLYSVFPWTMLSTAMSRCHSLAVLPDMPLSSSVQISDALICSLETRDPPFKEVDQSRRRQEISKDCLCGHRWRLDRKKYSAFPTVTRVHHCVPAYSRWSLNRTTHQVLPPIKDPTEAYFQQILLRTRLRLLIDLFNIKCKTLYTYA